MSWIGRIEAQDFVLLVRAGSNIHSIDDFQSQDQISFVSTGYGATVLAVMQIVAEQLGLMSKDPIFITGYEGTTDQLVALVRGDGNATIAPVSTALQYINSGNLRALAATGENRSKVLVDVPTFAELGYPALSQLNVQRSLAGPPGMDPVVLALLRKAFLRTMDDPEFKTASATAQMDVVPLSGDMVAAEVEANFSFYEKFKSILSNPN